MAEYIETAQLVNISSLLSDYSLILFSQAFASRLTTQWFYAYRKIMQSWLGVSRGLKHDQGDILKDVLTSQVHAARSYNDIEGV